MYLSESDQFSALMEELCAANDKPCTDARKKVFWDVLKDVPLPVVRAAIKNRIRSGGKFPHPAELRPKDAPREYKGVDAAAFYRFVSGNYPGVIVPGRYCGFGYKKDEQGNRVIVAFMAHAFRDLPEIRIDVAEFNVYLAEREAA
jgi:hypothetical protein